MPAIVVSIRIIRFLRDRLVITRQRLLERFTISALPRLLCASANVRLERDRLVVARQRFRGTLEVSQRIAAIVVRLCVVRLVARSPCRSLPALPRDA